MRQQLAVAYGLHSGDKPATREELASLDEKVKLEKPRDKVSVINLAFVDPNDDAKVNDSFSQALPG